MSSYDVIVAGVGAVGAATCRELSRRGLRVLGLDRFDVPNQRGSVTSHSRAIRLAYFEHPDYVSLLLRAYDLWESLEQQVGAKLLHLTGAIYAGPQEGRVVSDSLKAAHAHHLEYQLYRPAELKGRFPQFQMPDNYQAFYEERAGYVAALDAVREMVLDALRHGCVIKGHEPVENWEATSGGVRVRTPGNEYHAQKLVLCSGGWSSRSLQLELDLVVTRQYSGWVWPSQPSLFQPEVFPVFAIELPAGQFGRAATPGLFYGFPMTNAEVGFKCAIHAPGEAIDPDNVQSSQSARDLQAASKEFLDPLAFFLPDATGPLLANRTCLYTNSPDGRFIIDHHPASSNVCFACGLSGHGFKFAPVLGEALADLAQQGETELPIDFLSLEHALRTD